MFRVGKSEQLFSPLDGAQSVSLRTSLVSGDFRRSSAISPGGTLPGGNESVSTLTDLYAEEPVLVRRRIRHSIGYPRVLMYPGI